MRLAGIFLPAWLNQSQSFGMLKPPSSRKLRNERTLKMTLF